MKNAKIMHTFDVDEATKYGIQKAVLLQNIRFWLTKNRANNKNLHDGRYWTFNSSKAFGELFPYFNSKSIARWLNELEDDGVILSCKDYNKLSYDKTKWYTIPLEFTVSHIDISISQNKIPISQCELSVSQIEQSISQNEETIPYINTYYKTQIKNKNINTYSKKLRNFLLFVCDKTVTEKDLLLAKQQLTLSSVDEAANFLYDLSIITDFRIKKEDIQKETVDLLLKKGVREEFLV